MDRKAFFNGKFLDEEKVSLHVSDLSIQRGYGVFDFFRTVNGVPVFIDEHLDRFFHSADVLRLPLDMSRDEIKNIIYELIEHNKIPLSGIRLTLTGGYANDPYELDAPNFIITQQPLEPRKAALTEKGLKIITHEYVRDLPSVKSINYLMGIWLQQKVDAADANDVLYHKNSEVSEFPRSNFFIVTDEEVIATPSKNILHGITRAKTLELASAHYKTEERIVTLNNIYSAREAFMTSTTKQIIPIVKVNDVIIGNGKPGNITRRLDAELQALIQDHIVAQKENR